MTRTETTVTDDKVMDKGTEETYLGIKTVNYNNIKNAGGGSGGIR